MGVPKKHIPPPILTPEQAEFIADNFAALGDPSRARIIFVLTQGERNVGALAEIAENVRHALFHTFPALMEMTVHVDPCECDEAIDYHPSAHHMTTSQQLGLKN